MVWIGTDGGGVNYSVDGGATWETFTTEGSLGSNYVTSVWVDGTGVIWVGTYGGVSRLSLTAGASPMAGWLEPEGLVRNSVFRLLDARVLDAKFAGLNLAPARTLNDVEYTVVLSPTIGGEVLSTTFPAGSVSEAVLAPVAFGDETSPLAYGEYALALTALDSWGAARTTYRTIEIQARPILTHPVFYQEGAILRPVAEATSVPTTTFVSPLTLQSPLSTPTLSPPSPALTVPGDIVLITRRGEDLAPLTATFTLTDPDSLVEDVAVAYAWNPEAEADWRPLDKDGGEILASGLVSGSHVLAFRAIDPDGNRSHLLEASVRVVVTPLNLTWLLVGALVALAVVGATVVSLRHYPAYAEQWMAARDYPLQQIIPLIAPRGRPIDDEGLRSTLRALQAFSTPDQVRDALDGLVERGLMRREGDAYRFVFPWTARVHRWVQGRRADALAEQIRRQHPLYARTRGFFTQAHFRMEELGVEAFLFIPQGQAHPQADYGAMVAHLIAGRAPTGNDFTSVYQAAREHYGDDLAHRVALVVSDRRPEPGARYRLYEIRQREGLAIVPLDVSLFGQIKPERTANDILASEIDQATGQQNLYAISGPVSGDLSFFGRERVLQQVIDLLDVGQPVGIFGLRKVGKTSLIQRIQGRLAQRRPIAMVDTQKTAQQQGIWSLYPDIIAAFVGHLQRYQPDVVLPHLRLWPEAESPSPTLADAFVQDMQALHAALGAPDKGARLLLIVDEIDRLLPAGDEPGYEGFASLFGQLRAANQQAKLLDFLLVGVDAEVNRVERWHDHDNELYRALHEVWMPPMAHDDACEMIESLGFQMGVRYEREALHFLAGSGGGQPFVTRQLCSRAVEGRLGRGTITVKRDQARMAVETFVFDDPYLREMWRIRLDEAQREMLRTLAQASEPLPRLALLPAAQRQAAVAALAALEDYTLVRRREDRYAIAWDVFRKWIRWVELGLDT
jgi:hypothetical protein